MKSIKFYMVALLFLAFSTFSIAQTIHPLYEVATWKGFTNAAITYTFDDNCKNQYDVAIPLFNEFDFEGTFYPVINWSPNWTKFQEAVNEGHEIGSHTVTHTKLSDLSVAEQENELKNSKSQIETKLSGQKCNTIAYPFCVASNAAATTEHFIAARHCQGQIEKTTPPDFLNISSIICGDQGSVKTAADFKSRFTNAGNTNGWCVFLIHGIDNDGGYSSLDSKVLRESLDFLDQNREQYWVSTFVNVVRYIRERNGAKVTQTDSTNYSYQLSVTDELDNEIYNQPLTIRRHLPAQWSSNVVVTQNGVEADSKVIEMNSVKYVEFDAIPDAGTIEILNPDAKVGVKKLKEQSSIQIKPNPFSTNFTIHSDKLFSYYIHSLSGQLVEKGEGNLHHKVGQQLASGAYLLKILEGEFIFETKIIKN